MKANKIWHDVSERPVYNKDSKNCNQIVVYGGDEWEYSLSVCSMIDEYTIFAPISEREYRWGKCPFTKWAYVDDLLNLQANPEPVSGLDNGKMPVDRWKQACKAACIQANYRQKNGMTETRDDYFVDGVQWADEHPIKEPVSEDLEEAAEKYGRDTFVNECMENGSCDHHDLSDAFEAGAKWKEQQMTAKAVDGDVGYWNQRGLSVNVKLPKNLKEGDKVKVIIIKSE